MANKILGTRKYCDQKSYNGQPLRPGEVLVPFWCTKDMQLDNDTCIHDNFTTWKKGGYHFLIGFAPIQESAYEEYMKDFNRQINSFLDTWRAGRCIIGHRPDGTPVTCPKCNRCTGCEGENAVVMFHRHSGNHPYHQHGRARSLRQAVKSIQGHDAYQMNGRRPVRR